MKLAVETYIPVKKLGLEAGLRAIAAGGFDSVDFTFYFELEQLLLSGDYLALAHSARALLDTLGLTCRQSHAPFGLRSDEPFDLCTPHYENIVKSMQASAILGSGILVVHAVGLPADASEDARIETNLRLYKSLLPYCMQYGVKIGVENLGNILTTAQEHNRLMQQLDPAWFVTCLDVGHVSMKQMDPQAYIRALLPDRLKALHIHDNDGTDDQHQLMYLGKTDWPGVMRTLRQTGYDGDFTLESWRFLDCFPPQLLDSALSFEAAVARRLIRMFDTDAQG